MGDAAVAAMAIVTKVFNFLLSAVIGFGQGMQPVVGYNLWRAGAGTGPAGGVLLSEILHRPFDCGRCGGGGLCTSDRAVLPERPRSGGSGDTGIPVLKRLSWWRAGVQDSTIPCGRSWEAAVPRRWPGREGFFLFLLVPPVPMEVGGLGVKTHLPCPPPRFPGIGSLPAPLFPAGV